MESKTLYTDASEFGTKIEVTTEWRGDGLFIAINRKNGIEGTDVHLSKQQVVALILALCKHMNIEVEKAMTFTVKGA